MWTDVSSLVSWSFAVRFWFCCIAELSAWAGISLVSMVVWFYLSSTDQRLQFCSTIFSGLRRSTFNDRRMEELRFFLVSTHFLSASTLIWKLCLQSRSTCSTHFLSASTLMWKLCLQSRSTCSTPFYFTATTVMWNHCLQSSQIYIATVYFFFPLWCNWQTFFFNPVIR